MAQTLLGLTRTLLLLAGLTFALGLAQSPARADLLADIQKKGQITVATEARYPPFESVVDGQIVGYGPDMMKLIMEKMPDVKVNQLDVPWQGLLPGLATRKWDFAVTVVTITQERMKHFAFTTPIADGSEALVKRKGDDTISKPEDIAGKAVGAEAGSAQLEILQNFSKELAEKTGAGASEIKEYIDFNEAYADLAAGRIQAVANSMVNLAHLVKERPDAFEMVLPTIGPRVYFAWAGRNDPESASLLEFFNSGLLELKRSGKMDELQQKWLGITMELPDAVTDPGM